MGEGSLGRSPLIELQGIDGRLYFFDEHTGSGKTKQIIFSVKAAHIGPALRHGAKPGTGEGLSHA